MPPVAQPVPQQQPQPMYAPQPVSVAPDQGADISATQPVPAVPQIDAVQWQAPEYVQHARTPLWYVGFWAVVVVLVLVAIFVLQSWSFAILVPAMAVALMMYSHRPPRLMSYALSQRGLYINDQLHPLSEFKSFGIMQQDQLPSLMLIPTKRFKPGITVYFPSEVGEQIVDMLGSRVPMQELRLDAFDKIIRKLRI